MDINSISRATLRLSEPCRMGPISLWVQAVLSRQRRCCGYIRAKEKQLGKFSLLRALVLNWVPSSAASRSEWEWRSAKRLSYDCHSSQRQLNQNMATYFWNTRKRALKLSQNIPASCSNKASQVNGKRTALEKEMVWKYPPALWAIDLFRGKIVIS